MILSSKKRAFLRKKAHKLEAIVRIGKDGITENLITSISDAITKRELIKVKVLQNCKTDKKEIEDIFIKNNEFDVVGMIGRSIILYRENKDNPSISLDLKYIK